MMPLSPDIGFFSLSPSQFVLNSVSQVVLYIVFSSLAFASVAGLLLVRPTRDIARGPIEQIRLSETVRALFERRTRYLWGAVAYSGLSSAFNNVIYTSYIGEVRETKKLRNRDNLFYLFFSFFSTALGWLGPCLLWSC